MTRSPVWLTRASGSAAATLALASVAGCGHRAQVPPTSGRTPLLRASSTTAAGLTNGQPIPGPSGQPDGIYGGTLTAATGVLANTGFGLVAPRPGSRPRLSVQQAYASRYASIVAMNSATPPPLKTGPVITLAMATMSYYKPSHDALVWVFVWPHQQCFFSGGPPVGSGTPPPTANPLGVPCTSWSIMSDSTGQIMIGGDASTR
ncbi:MAG: hypothetical protein QOI76_407 [Frankiales bacterium]|nr:hypothetical protein [Frankiales bacterium]